MLSVVCLSSRCPSDLQFIKGGITTNELPAAEMLCVFRRSDTTRDFSCSSS
jgi:hypothetical protein